MSFVFCLASCRYLKAVRFACLSRVVCVKSTRSYMDRKDSYLSNVNSSSVVILVS